MSDPIIHNAIATWNFAARATGLHGAQGMASVTLRTQDGKYNLQIDPAQFPWIQNNDVLICSVTVLKTMVKKAEPILDLKPN